MATRSIRAMAGLTALLIMAAACAPEPATVVAGESSASQQVQGETTATDSAGVVTWRSLGCPEPAAIVPETSAALEQDVGLASGSLVESAGVSAEEAMRRLRLQETMVNG